MPSLEARLARNEVMFRAINERIREPAGRFDQSGSEALGFVCECADETVIVRKIGIAADTVPELS
jgi:hypothetical protein